MAESSATLATCVAWLLGREAVTSANQAAGFAIGPLVMLSTSAVVALTMGSPSARASKLAGRSTVTSLLVPKPKTGNFTTCDLTWTAGADPSASR